MPRFWKHKSDKPIVWGYSGWYYSVEYYGITRTFIDIERLRVNAIEIGEQKRIPVSYSKSIWSRSGFVMRMYHLRVRFIHFRHRKEIVNLYEQAYAQFSSEMAGDEETEPIKQNN